MEYLTLCYLHWFIVYYGEKKLIYFELKDTVFNNKIVLGKSEASQICTESCCNYCSC